MTVKTLLIEYDDANGDVMGGYPLRAPAVEVVRCRDCYFSLAHGHGCARNQDIFDTDPDGFCSWGERRDGC